MAEKEYEFRCDCCEKSYLIKFNYDKFYDCVLYGGDIRCILVLRDIEYKLLEGECCCK